MPIGLDADIASLEALIGALALSIGVEVPMLDDDAADIGVVIGGVVSAGAVLLQPPSTSAAVATAMPIGHVIRFVMSISRVKTPDSILRACQKRRPADPGDTPMAEPCPASQNDRLQTRETTMAMTRREWVGKAAALGLLPLAGMAGAQEGTLKISHQFPGGTATEGDFRDRLCRRFAADIEKRSNGAMKAAVYPGSSLMKTNAQFSAMRKGALDISLYPMPYAGGEVAECNIGLMPALVPSYEVGAAWKTSEVGRILAKMLDEKGIVLLSWIWQAGGVASRATPLVAPEDAKGLKVRGGSREMDLMLKAAGASVISLPSNEIYAAMQTGAMDAAMTSSTSFISFKLEEIAKSLTSGRNKAYWFMFEPLMMSKDVFAKLPKAQQDVLMAAGAEQEKFAYEAAKADDKIAADVYAKAGAKVFDLDEPTVRKWQAIARDTAWKDYGDRSETAAALLKAAQKLLA